jgi:hypothetical protein
MDQSNHMKYNKRVAFVVLVVALVGQPSVVILTCVPSSCRIRTRASPFSTGYVLVVSKTFFGLSRLLQQYPNVLADACNALSKGISSACMATVRGACSRT